MAGNPPSAKPHRTNPKRPKLSSRFWMNWQFRYWPKLADFFFRGWRKRAEALHSKLYLEALHKRLDPHAYIREYIRRENRLRWQKRDLRWWLRLVLDTLGLIGGPVAMANLFSDLIEWHGPINFIVAYWDKIVGEPFHTIFAWIASLVGITLPAWTKWITDYLVLGIILLWGYVRASILVPEKLESERDYTVLSPPGSHFWLYVQYVIEDGPRQILLWPMRLILITLGLINSIIVQGKLRHQRASRHDDRWEVDFYSLQLLTFFLFFILWIVNVVVGG